MQIPCLPVEDEAYLVWLRVCFDGDCNAFDGCVCNSAVLIPDDMNNFSSLSIYDSSQALIRIFHPLYRQKKKKPRRSIDDLLRCLMAASSSSSHRSITYMLRPGNGKPRALTLIPGDGMGPLVTNAVEQVMEAMHTPVYFEKSSNISNLGLCNELLCYLSCNKFKSYF
ncbi:hypothetical protein LINPERHAP1_LOCUS22078 [Linum perenne]